MADFKQSNKLHNVLYDIRGPLLEHAKYMEAEGHRILKLNIGNPAPFGFEAPDAILVDMIRHLPNAQGYSDSRGIFSARTAVVQYYQGRGIQNPSTASACSPASARTQGMSVQTSGVARMRSALVSGS